MSVEPGSVVVAPLGPRQLIGVAWEAERLQTEEVGDNRLRPLAGLVDVPPIPAPLRRLVEWTADYYLSPIAAVLRMVLLDVGRAGRPSADDRISSDRQPPARLTPQREQALARIEGRQGTVRELAAHAEVSEAVMRGLVHAGALGAGRGRCRPALPRARPRLRAAFAQRRAAGGGGQPERRRSARASILSCSTALPGRARPKSISRRLPRRLRQGKQVLVLLPEIALTEPFLTRFTAALRLRAGDLAFSDLRSSQRRRAWRAIAKGEAKVVVGARSSLFLPYPNLGLIVVDEAHEPSFKQEEGVQYHARDVAVMRGHFEEIPVILASATPAIETRHMVEIGRYRELKLTERHGLAEMPEIRALDLTQDPPPRGRWLAPSLVAELEANLGRGRAIAPVPQPPRLRAADPVPASAATASNAPIAPRGWSSTG